MKRSERLASLRASLLKRIHCLTELTAQTTAEQLLQEEEAAFGLKWDPEAAVLPVRLWISHHEPCAAVDRDPRGDGIGLMIAAINSERGDQEYRQTILAEMVRRYNAWPALREIVQQWASYLETSKRYALEGDRPSLSVPALLDILDGTGEEAAS